jgi:acyl-CoA dehydrogenase
MSDETMVALGEDFPELRESVRRICAKYPGTYWSALEDEQAYPTAFVNELTEAGFLGALIPEEYGGSGLPVRAAAVILDVHHGDVVAAWVGGAEARFPARHRGR